MTVTLIHSDCIEAMRAMPDASVDSICTDPPYELGFMGKAWDSTGIACSVLMWTEALRVLKPGGYLLAFSGSRTYHRMACAIEDAGFDIRDQIMWLYSSGFPKSHNLDNLRGEVICGCGSESKTERNVRPVRSGDVPAAESPDEECRQVLQPSLSQSGTPIAGRTKFPAAEIRSRQSSLEGWGNDFQEEGQLQGRSLHQSAGLDATDGAQGRLHHGASDGDGRVVRILADQDGSGSSRQPQPDAEQSDEHGIVAGQPKPQVGGTWPICGGCGKPILPKGLGTALKPAHEPICMARKPLIGTVAANVELNGTGALNIAACRIQTDEKLRVGSGGIPCRHDVDTPRRAGEASANSTYADAGGTNFAMTPGPRGGDAAGRWPANVIHDGSDEVVRAFPYTASGHSAIKRASSAQGHGNAGAAYGAESRAEGTPMVSYGDAGSAARFFYCAKASKDDRDEGLERFKRYSKSHIASTDGGGGGWSKDSAKNPNLPRANTHPTVKPTDLMRYLCRLVTPPGGTVLDPFMGSGSTGKAAVLEGFNFIGIDMTAEYVEIARGRIDHAQRQDQQPSLDMEAT